MLLKWFIVLHHGEKRLCTVCMSVISPLLRCFFSEPIDLRPPTDPPCRSQNPRSHLPDNHHGCQGFGSVPNFHRFQIFACIFVPWAPFLDTAAFWSLCAQFAVGCFFPTLWFQTRTFGPFGTMPVSCIWHKGTHPGGNPGRPPPAQGQRRWWPVLPLLLLLQRKPTSSGAPIGEGSDDTQCSWDNIVICKKLKKFDQQCTSNPIRWMRHTNSNRWRCTATAFLWCWLTLHLIWSLHTFVFCLQVMKWIY